MATDVLTSCHNHTRWRDGEEVPATLRPAAGRLLSRGCTVSCAGRDEARRETGIAGKVEVDV